jgi:hypothetical protein
MLTVTMRAAGISVAAAIVTLLSVDPARADEQTATLGAVSATLSFTYDEDEYRYSDVWLTVSRDGQVLFDDAPSADGCVEECGLGRIDDTAVHVRDLDGDGEPEVLLDLFSGGAHCCFIARVYAFDGTTYREHARNFADPGYRVTDLDGDAIPEFLSADHRFAYRFTSFASSIFPVQVWSYDQGGFRDVTDSFPARIHADERRAWRLYRRFLRGNQYEPRGAIAAWAANRYRLGRRASTLRTLRRLARRGELRGSPPKQQLRFVRELDGFLTRLGYAA